MLATMPVNSEQGGDEMSSAIDPQGRESRDIPAPSFPAAEPPRTPVRARTPLDPQDFAARTVTEPGSLEAQVALELFSTHHQEARAYATRLRRLATLWDDTDEDGDAYADLVAEARRVTLDQARTLLRDAALAVTSLPHTLERLDAGHMPVSWFEQILRRVRHLTPEQCRQLDDRVADWDLANIRRDRFTRELGILIAWFGVAATRPSPQEQRAVALEVNPEHDGTACLHLTGPVHEIVDLSHRLDAAARAVQDEQRRALADGRPVPFDIDGAASREGRQLTLAALRYAILTRSVLETGGIEAPGSWLRLQVVVPAMTLLGESEAPGTIDGTIPLPAPMARHLAAGESTWYRILTDPSDGAFLPLPAKRYSPTLAMQEHLRLLNPVCAVPGCTRNTCTIGEADHIEEYDHENPENGGRTAIENLHRLCWKHHRLKTLGLLDPVREPDGSTTWILYGRAVRRERQNTDLLTPALADALQRSWEIYEETLVWDEARHRGLLEDADPAPLPDPAPHPEPPF